MRDNHFIVKSAENNDAKIEVRIDDMSVDPRSWDNLGTIVTWHRRYNLGDEQPKEGVEKWRENLAIELGGEEVYDKMVDIDEDADIGIREAKEKINDIIVETLEDKIVELPVYIYDHSGITINTSGYSSPWDSGQLGYIYATFEDAKEWFKSRMKEGESIKSRKWFDRIIEVLQAEIKTYDQYICNDVYCIAIYKKEKCSECGQVKYDMLECLGGLYLNDLYKVEDAISDHFNIKELGIEDLVAEIGDYY